MTTPLTEHVPHRGGFLVSEDHGVSYPSREVVTLLSGQNLVAGTVLGRVLTAAAVATADGGNTGDGVMGSITVGDGAVEGTYTLVITKETGNAGDFEVRNPAGVVVGVGTVAVAFAGGGLSFTLADGTNDFDLGDSIAIVVTASAIKYQALDLSGTDGSEHAAAILFDDEDATAGDKQVLVIARDADVNLAELTFPDGITVTQKAAALADLAALNPPIRAL